jgi:polyphosphate kinase 2 (PPK2 family)
LPWLWRFWQKLPNWGEIGIYDRSWYKTILHDYVEGKMSELTWKRRLDDIVSFERTLADDSYIFVKFFLHIDRKTQKKRFKKLKTDPFDKWKLDTGYWQSLQKYEEYLVAIEEMLAMTESEWGPWTIIEANDRRWARVKILKTIEQRLTEGLEAHSQEGRESA